LTARGSCGWAGDFAALISSESTALATELARGLIQRGHEQFSAWVSSISILRTAASRCVEALPAASAFGAILEYELPRDDRRPDVIVLQNGTVVVIEFKEGAKPTTSGEDQVRCYARDLRHYHSACREREIVPFLVPVGYRGPVRARRGVTVMPADHLSSQILALTPQAPLHRPDTSGWLEGQYAPLPGIAQAARALFHREPLPRIKRADAAGIPRVIARLLELTAEAQRERSRKVVLLTGVPGSGKTLIGLQLVHSEALDALVPSGRRGGAPGVFLSGNDPLVDVLQTALKSTDFVQSLKAFLKLYIARSDAAPPEHVLVFDEAQRAWDEKHVLQKHAGTFGSRSEPELLLTIADRIPEWCLVLALMGEGQEIHVGEEDGLALWAEALRKRDGWKVHAENRVAQELSGAGVPVGVEPLFRLDATLRAHVAEGLHRWVECLLAGRLDQARILTHSIEGHDLYVTRDFERAREYVRDRYAGQSDRRYGLLASSCAENLRPFAARIKEDNIGARYGRWYEGEPRGANFCCSLETAVSEFGCQGLELDFAVLCWADDLTWQESRWMQRGGKKRRGARDYQRLRINAYRVLLTRGRDGTCVFVPSEPAVLMDPVYQALIAAGVQPLPAD
jgi:hypothetical protein